jgi:NAD(P)-dependent dehydrogenase (short-subunit alcohol dehydrogenase family)
LVQDKCRVLQGPFLCCQRVARWMIDNGGGTILSIASTAGIAGISGCAAYGPAKAGIINMTRVLAIEWAKYHIRVNCIAPSFVNTPMHEESLKKGVITLQQIEKWVPLGRIAEPEEIANAALFLVSDDSSYMTGITMPVDGGFLAFGNQTD